MQKSRPDRIETIKGEALDHNLSIYSINTDESSLRVLPLPSFTDDDQVSISELVPCFDKNSNLLKIDKTGSIFIRASSNKRPQTMDETKNSGYDVSPYKVFAKMRTNSTNIVKEIKKIPANSYAARKEKYLKSLKIETASRLSNNH